MCSFVIACAGSRVLLMCSYYGRNATEQAGRHACGGAPTLADVEC